MPDRDIERTRYFVRGITNGRGFIHRFTIRSEEMARKVLESFSPEELLMVELLPQFPEAPAFVPYVKTGRQAEAGSAMTDADQGTICCVDGFCINFPDRRFRLISPARTDKTFSKGIYESEWVTFADADDFEQKPVKMLITKKTNDVK